MALGSALMPLLPEGVTRGIGFAILFLLGLMRLFDAALKARIRRDSACRVKFRALGLHFLLEVYADPELADMDDGGTLSPGEAALLALALSIDGAVAGLGAAGASIALTVASSLVMGLVATFLGLRVGALLAKKGDISPLGGVLLIAIAFAKLARG
jgi:putative sporulation protein YtaF